MTTSRKAIIKDMITSRKNLIQLIIVAILLSLGVNLIASQLIALALLSPLFIISVGISLIVGSMAYLVTRLLVGRNESRTFVAFITYDNKKNKIIPNPRYEISESIHEYIECGFKENPALKTIWKKDRLKFFSAMEEGKGKRSAKLISQAAEYFVLDQLSTHLEDYFALDSSRKKS